MEKAPVTSFAMPEGVERKRAESRYRQMSSDEAKRHVGKELYPELQRILRQHELLEPIAKGAERLVFAIHALKKSKKDEDSLEKTRETRERNVVAKLHVKTLIQQVVRYEQGDCTDRQAEAELEELQRAYTDRDKELKEFFGKAAVLPSRSIVTEVPLDEELFLALLQKDSARSQIKRLIETAKAEGRPFPQAFPVLVEIQPRHDEIEGSIGRELQLVAGYAEYGFPGFDSSNASAWIKRYEKASKLLTEKNEDVFPLPFDEETVLTSYPDLKDLAASVSVNENVRSKLAEFAKQAMKYTEQTGMVLDVAGHRNIFMEKSPRGVHVRMMDPIYHDEGALPLFTKTIGILNEYTTKDLESMDTIPAEEAFNAFNVLHEVRLINAYAIIAGIPERLEIAGLSDVQPRVWLEQFERVFLKSTRDAKIRVALKAKKERDDHARAALKTVELNAGG